MKKQPLVLAMLSALASMAHAADTPSLPDVVVNATRPDGQSDSVPLSSTDTATSLTSHPGVTVNAAGGVSGLPAIRGLSSDRIKVFIDGADATAACGNHMNPPLSYASPSQLAHTEVMAGLAPVSSGGDNIAGVIDAQSRAPRFADAAGEWISSGSLSLTSRSVDNSLTEDVQAALANDRFSIQYAGSHTKADSYKDGHGNKVLDTLFESINQSVTMAAQGSGQRVTLKLSEQHIPYQGYANQYMDMTDNHSMGVNLGYEGEMPWGRLEARLYWQNTFHEMGFFSTEKAGTMPMDTHGLDTGYRIKGEVPLSKGTLRIGHEFHRFQLNDWWPPVTGSMMMSPNTYVNINDGQRDRLAFFGEWEGRLNEQWTTQLGLRHETVSMTTGTVQGYGCMMCTTDTAAANAFNSADRSKRDQNLDLQAAARYQASAQASYEFGYARKTRSPNLYERYSWGLGNMAMKMLGWFGDANGYVGNLNLKPEVAHTISGTLDWHDATKQSWQLQVTPFYSYIEDFIDVDVIGTFTQSGNVRNKLQFANHDAQLYGVNVAGQWSAWRNTAFGEGTLKAQLDWTHGVRNDGVHLYHIMPANMTITLAHSQGAWHNQADLQLVARKSSVSEYRLENETGGYGLLNLSTRYDLNKRITLQAGIRNVFDKSYDLPLGGVNWAALKAGETSTFESLPGQGRSIDVGVRIQF